MSDSRSPSDDEQQKNDAELGEVRELVGLHKTQHRRANQHPGEDFFDERWLTDAAAELLAELGREQHDEQRDQRALDNVAPGNGSDIRGILSSAAVDASPPSRRAGRPRVQFYPALEPVALGGSRRRSTGASSWAAWRGDPGARRRRRKLADDRRRGAAVVRIEAIDVAGAVAARQRPAQEALAPSCGDCACRAGRAGNRAHHRRPGSSCTTRSHRSNGSRCSS